MPSGDIIVCVRPSVLEYLLAQAIQSSRKLDGDWQKHGGLELALFGTPPTTSANYQSGQANVNAPPLLPAGFVDRVMIVPKIEPAAPANGAR